MPLTDMDTPSGATDGRQILLGQLHNSLYDSSKSLGATDTILVGATYLFNLLMLGLTFAASKHGLIFLVFLVVLVTVNALIIITFRNSRQMREKIDHRLRTLYSDLKMSQYFDDSIIENYRRRYAIWTTLDLTLGAMALTVSLLIRFVYRI